MKSFKSALRILNRMRALTPGQVAGNTRAVAVSCLLMLLLLFPQDLQAQAQADKTEKRILILPFQIHAAKDMAYLEKAVTDMLSSRLEKAGQVRIIEGDSRASAVSEVTALGEKHHADYVVTGSMTFFGDEVSTDARVYETGRTAPVIVFHEYGNTGDGVLVHIEKLAQNIAGQVLAGGQTGSSATLQEKTGMQTPSTESAFSWYSQKLPFPVVGLSAGDLDGDGRLEWILAGESAVYIYSIEAKTLVLETTLPQKNSIVIGVDAVDLDADQRAEIFITRKKRENHIDTAVVEWNGSVYAEQQKGLKWYFRTVFDERNRLILIGQKQGHVDGFRSGPSGRHLFEPGIYRFKKENGSFLPGQVLPLPEDINIYWVGCGDIMGNGGIQTVYLGRKDFLSLISGNETVEWSSAEPYGGSNVYLDTPSGDNLNDTDRRYLSQRIHVTDMNGDGKAEVILARNVDAGGRLFKKFRNYKSGSVAVLSWQETALDVMWETGELSGYISDTWLVDVTRNGRPELAYSLVTPSGGLGGDETSRLYINEIPVF